MIEPLRAPVCHLATQLKELGKSHAVGLVIFGSAAAGTIDPIKDAIHSVALFDTIDLHVLKQLAVEGQRLGSFRLAAPLVFTPKELKSSCDTFALEFIEIQQQHVVVFGEDYFASLEFRDSDVRLQCERELKVVAVGIHHGLLTAGDESHRLEHLCVRFGEQVLRTLRGVLWIKGIREPRPAFEVLAHAEKIVERPLPGVRGAALRMAPPDWKLFCALHADVKALEAFVDAL